MVDQQSATFQPSCGHLRTVSFYKDVNSIDLYVRNMSYQLQWVEKTSSQCEDTRFLGGWHCLCPRDCLELTLPLNLENMYIEIKLCAQ